MASLSLGRISNFYFIKTREKYNSLKIGDIIKLDFYIRAFSTE